MACLDQKSIIDLPDEVIEEIMDYLSCNEIFNLSIAVKIYHCAKRVSRNKPFSKYIIPGKE